MSEKLDAQQVVKLLNEYFTRMVDVIMEHGGVVDKYIGDALMVIFGAPVSTEHDSLNAVKAAVQMRSELAKRNAELMAEGEAPIRTGIGLHTGDMVAGNIGSDRRKEYTVIGDAVNLASRLEGETKNLGSDLVISESTYERVGRTRALWPSAELTYDLIPDGRMVHLPAVSGGDGVVRAAVAGQGRCDGAQGGRSARRGARARPDVVNAVLSGAERYSSGRATRRPGRRRSSNIGESPRAPGIPSPYRRLVSCTPGTKGDVGAPPTRGGELAVVAQ